MAPSNKIYVFLRKLAAQGHAIIMITSEMSELIGMADRILVMRLGRIAGSLERPDVFEESIVRLSMGLEATSSDTAAASTAQQTRL